MTSPSVKILIVDDHRPTVEQWTQTLQEKQFDVLSANHGQAAYHLACEQQPDLILSDIDMPEIDGFELLTLLKKTPSTRRIPVVFCSGTTDQTSQYLARTLGATAYLTKPLSVSALTDIVAEHCCFATVSV